MTATPESGPLDRLSAGDRLESLLRSAVDEQVHEQRQLSQLLAEVRAALATRTEEGTPGGTAGEAETARAALDAALDTIAAAQSQTRQRLDEVDRRIEKTLAAVGSVSEGVAAFHVATTERATAEAVEGGPSTQDLYDGLAGVRTDLRALPEQLTPGIAQAVGAVVGSSARDSAQRVDALERRVADSTEQLTALREQMAEPIGVLPQMVSVLEVLSDQLRRLDGVPAAVAALDGVDPELRAALVSLATGPAPAGEVRQVLDERLGMHLTALSAGVGERLEALEARVGAVGDAQSALALSAGAPASAEMAGLRRDVEALRDLLPEPVQQGPAAQEIADIVREGVRDATRDFVRDYLREAVQDIVTVSTRETERRITEHVDEAVLALAQALLRRRSTLTGALTASLDVSVPAAEAAVSAAFAKVDTPTGPGALRAVLDHDDDSDQLLRDAVAEADDGLPWEATGPAEPAGPPGPAGPSGAESPTGPAEPTATPRQTPQAKGGWRSLFRK